MYHISESRANLSPCLYLGRRRCKRVSRWDSPRTKFGHSMYARPSKVCSLFNAALRWIITGTSSYVLSSCSRVVHSLPCSFSTSKRDLNLLSDFYFIAAWLNLYTSPISTFTSWTELHFPHCITSCLGTLALWYLDLFTSWTHNVSQAFPTHSQPLYLLPYVTHTLTSL